MPFLSPFVSSGVVLETEMEVLEKQGNSWLTTQRHKSSDVSDCALRQPMGDEEEGRGRSAVSVAFLLSCPSLVTFPPTYCREISD